MVTCFIHVIHALYVYAIHLYTCVYPEHVLHV